MTSMDNLLRHHYLPNKLRYESDSISTNVVSATMVNQTGPCQLAYSPAVSSQLHETLIRSTDWIFPRDDEHIGRTVHDASAVSTFAEHLDSTSTWAKDAARNQLVSGEMGESLFLMAYLILPLNNLLRLIFSGTRWVAYWRFVGIGSGGEPGIELVCTRPDGTCVKLAVCEIKTIDAFTNRNMHQLLSDIRDERLSMNGHNAFYEQGKATVPPTQQSKSCKIVQQVSHVLL